ncbi:unnamed protein product, partial [Closterium sp. Naga37s-1]
LLSPPSRTRPHASPAQHSTAQHSTAQHSTAQHSTAQHSTAQHSTAQHSALHTRPAMELNQQERPAGSVEGGRPSLQEQQQEEPGQRGVRSLQEVEEEARRQVDPSVFLILLNCASPGVPEEQLAVHFSSRFNRRPHPNSALEKMMHT